jgi:prophage maintenance system killer protein
MTWRWVSKEALLLLHGESLAEHGGRAGLREPGLLDSALRRPLNLLAFGDPDASDLASSYAAGVVKNHPFVDGNKQPPVTPLKIFSMTAMAAATLLGCAAPAEKTSPSARERCLASLRCRQLA